jgi:transcription initiation factor TFIIIB Brf1 subunit/transcription initiation factor TFIIB
VNSTIKEKPYYTKARVNIYDKKEQVTGLNGDIKCPECGSDDIYHGKHEVVCRNCGMVLDESIPDTTRPGWRIFDASDMKKVHSEKVRIDKGLTTEISRSMKDYSGNVLSPEMLVKMRRLSKRDFQHKETRDERVLRKGVNDMEILCTKLHIPKAVKNKAITDFKRYIKNNTLRGKTIASMFKAFVFKACKENGIPYKLREFVKKTQADSSLEKNYLEIINNKNMVISPVFYISRFASKLKLGDEATPTAMKMMNDVVKNPAYRGASIGKETPGYAAAVVYLSSLHHGLQPIREMRLVSIMTNVAESTLKKRVDEIMEILGLDKTKYRENKKQMSRKKEKVRIKLK